MGSLMAGWDSPVSDPKSVYRRSKSLTKQEIEAFWKSKKRKEEEHLREISVLSPRGQEEIIFENSSSETLSSAKDKLLESQSSLEKLLQKNGWWISSNSAFLNEPPVIAPEGSNQKYASQFHVADLGGLTKPHAQTGIGA